jgi:hypothetical protein
MLTGILKVLRLPPQSTFWRFLASLHLSVAGQILKMQRVLRQRVWEAAHVQLKVVTMDTATDKAHNPDAGAAGAHGFNHHRFAEQRPDKKLTLFDFRWLGHQRIIVADCRLPCSGLWRSLGSASMSYWQPTRPQSGQRL